VSVSDGRYGIALFDYAAKSATQLSFKANDVLCVTHADSTGVWFKGHLEDAPDAVGLFPVAFVRIEPDYVPKALRSQLSAALSTKPTKEKEKKSKDKSKDKPDHASKGPLASVRSADTRTRRSMSVGGDDDNAANAPTPPALPPLPASPTLARAPHVDDDPKSPKRRSPSSAALASPAPAADSATPPKSKSKAAAAAVAADAKADDRKLRKSSKISGLTSEPAPAAAAPASLVSPRSGGGGGGAAMSIDNVDAVANYEERVGKRDVTKDALASELLLFPANDVRVVTVPRPLRQCVTTLAAPAPPSDADEHLRIALATSTRDFVVVHRKTRDALAGKAAPVPAPTPSDRAADKELLRSPMAPTGKTSTTLSKDADREFSEAEHAKLLANLQLSRRHVFELHARTDRSGDALLFRAPAPLPEAPRAAVQLRVTLLSVKLAVDVGEAFFVAMALYDLRTRQKLSETWHVDANEDDVLLQFEERKRGNMHPETRARSALFGVSLGAELTRERARDLVLVARVERVACADEAAGVDLYCRGELKPKEAEKARTAAEAARTLLGNVLQPFAWSYVRPFADDDAGDATRPYELRTARSTLSFERLYKLKADRLRDDVLYDELRKRDESTDRSALIPGSLECAVALVHAAAAPPAGRLDASMRLLQPTPDDDVKLVAKHKMPRTPLVRELCTFGAARVAGVQLEYVNQLHVQCEWLDLHNLAAAANARNIVCAVSLRLDDRLADSPGWELVYGGASAPRLVAEAVSPLTYRTRRPQFYFEAKIELPVTVPRGAHLLFTFRHVACRLKTGGLFSLESKEDASCVLGYACLPLLAIDSRDDQPLLDADVDTADGAAPAAPSARRVRDDISPLQLVHDGEHLLSVAKSLPPLYLQAYVDETPELPWVDKKPVFQCRTTLTSSVHTNSAPLALFFAGAKEAASGDELRAACRQLASVDASVATAHFASIADQLVALVALNRAGARWACAALVELAVRIEQHTRGTGKVSARNALLDAYVHYLFAGGDGAARILHRFPCAFVDALLKLLDEPDARSGGWQSLAWFLFGMLSKAIAVECAHRSVLDDAHARPSRVPDATLASLRQLVERLAAEVLQLATRLPTVAVSLNRTVAQLFVDLFDFCDRGFVFQLVLLYVRRLRHSSTASAASLLAKLRLELHSLLSSYEHYAALNLPLPFEFRSAATLRSDWWRRHCLVGLLIDECAESLKGELRLAKHTAAATVRSVLFALARAARSGDARCRVTDMFFPVLQLLCDHVDHVTGGDEDDEDDGGGDDDGDASGSSAGGSGRGELRRNASKNLRRRQSERRTLRNPSTMSSKAFGLLSALRSKKVAPASAPAPIAAAAAAVSDQKPHDDVAQALIDSERSDWLACVVHLTNACSPELLSKWIRGERSARVGAFAALLAAAVRRFAADGCSDLLARETCATAIQTAAILFEELQRDIGRNDQLRLDVFAIVAELLTVAPPVDLLLGTFTLVRRFLREHAVAVFLGDDTSYAASLCVHVLRYCGSPNDDVRSHAAALWLRLATGNMRVANNIGRLKLRATIAMSSLAGGAAALDSNAMKSALEAVVRHTAADDGRRSWALNAHSSLRHDGAKKEAQATSDDGDGDGADFEKQLSALTQRLFGVLKNSILLAETKADAEMEADLLHRLSLNHADSPVLRVTWLENLAQRHVERHRWTEAACCYTLVASLSAAHLRQLGGAHAAGVPADDGVFRAVCLHIKSEPGLPATEQQPGVYDSPVFSRDGLCDAVQSAIGLFIKAELFELAVKMYGVLLSLYIAVDDYGRVSRAAAQLPAHCERLQSLQATEARIFANYYCVSFHGEPWKEFAGRSYIVKTPASERVAEFTEALQARYGARFGADGVRVLGASETPDAIKARCHADKRSAFVQIAAVRPHASANTKRKTEFDMNHNVMRFAAELPFVPGGGSYATTAKQWKRRIVYRCVSTFPHLSTRLLVEHVDERQLSPLACAVETIGGRADQLLEEINAPHPDSKQLQLLLQGSVLLQVNAGPLEIANTFFRADCAGKDDLAPGEKVEALQNKLRAEFTRFIDAASDAVQLNGTLIEADQAEFQLELEKGLERTKAVLKQFLTAEQAEK
jgi:hypothetical protein